MSQMLPDSCGVYLFKKKDKVLYVGKALSIRKRIASHKQSEDPKIHVLFSLADDVEYILCDNEIESLILENTLIKKFAPPFNMRLKDDTSYPYIKITDERFPRILVMREQEKKGGQYFGPYTDVAAARDALKSVRQIFPFRTTKKKISGKEKPCLNFHLKLCPAPCAGKISEAEYQSNIENVRMFLEGKYGELEMMLAEEMRKASEALDFECAGNFRDRLFAIRRTMERQKITDLRGKERDIVGMAFSQDKVCFSVLSVRDGTMNDAKAIIADMGMGSPKDILESFLKQYYEKNYAPSEILLSLPIGDESIKTWLEKKLQKKVTIYAPRRGTNKKFCRMAQRNAELALSQKTNPLLELKKILSLPKEPRLIEAFDVSNIFGKEAVGSLVVFEDGKPKKSAYRRFRVRTEGINDVAMIAEIVSRRYSHYEYLPDLIVVDGGAGQLHAAYASIKKKGISVPLMGLAKKNEEIHVPNRKNPIILRKESYALRLLQALRDEAHRFAIQYHKKLRAKKMEASLLDGIDGIGQKRKRKLMLHFKSLEGIKSATVEEITSVLKNEKIARKVYESLKETAQ